MQKLPLPFAAGDAVIARGERWLVEETTSFEDCVLIDLTAPGGRDNERRRARLLHPFDRPVFAERGRTLRVVTKKRWMSHLESRVADARLHGQLRSARWAAIDIFPFQLEPVLALIRGLAARVLLADEVGLGKTIQAGLMLAELQQRGWCERALVLSPAGLCAQWCDELQRRFQITTSVFDRATLRRFADALPINVNPWSVEPVAITSIDFIKQPEVLRAVTSVLWDIVIIDEAHQVATAPRRAAAVNTVACRARHVVLVTATPHAGDDVAYRSLCAIGQVDDDDPLLLFRRTRATVGLMRTRRVHLLRVRSGADEIEMHRLLAQYAKRLWQIGTNENARDARLVAMVFSKRAMSSASSLAASVERRLAIISGRVAPPLQSELPFPTSEDDDGARDAEPVLGVSGFEGVDDEQAALLAILAVAERAREQETKVRALVRLLRRVREPVVVFTEYRDTLAMLERSVGAFRRISLLHGGMSAADRRGAVHSFNTGASDLLLATDAGSEGLNLQSRCRLVVNLELPWNPMRLEQRIGRVDRLGQSRTVHAINLFADGTAEAAVLANLYGRLRRIRASEIEIAACVIDGGDTLPQELDQTDTVGSTISADLTNDATAEAARLTSLTRLPLSGSFQRDAGHVTVAVLASRNRKRSALWFFHARIVNGSGRLVEETLIPVQVALSRAGIARICGARCSRDAARATANHLLEHVGAAVASAAQHHVDHRAAEIASETRAWVARALTREHRLAQLVRTGDVLFQAGLFETRALRNHEDARGQQEQLLEETAAHAGTLELDAVMSGAHTPELALLLIRC